MKGMGEKQIEVDKRILRNQVSILYLFHREGYTNYLYDIALVSAFIDRSHFRLGSCYCIHFIFVSVDVSGN